MTHTPSDVETEPLAREPIFHHPELGATRQDYLAQTAEWEVRASGPVYDREHVVDTLVQRGKVPGDENWLISDVRCRPPGERTYALTCQLDQDSRLSRRLTLWQRGVDDTRGR